MPRHLKRTASAAGALVIALGRVSHIAGEAHGSLVV